MLHTQLIKTFYVKSQQITALFRRPDLPHLLASSRAADLQILGSGGSYTPPSEVIEYLHNMNRMKYLRIARGFTRAQLAQQSGVGYKTIQKIEHNLVRCPRSRTAQKLAQALHVEPAKLVRLISEAPEDPIRRGSRLREARCACEMSQAEVALLANISQGHLSQLESGNYEASPATIQRLAHALGVKPTELLGVE